MDAARLVRRAAVGRQTSAAAPTLVHDRRPAAPRRGRGVEPRHRDRGDAALGGGPPRAARAAPGASELAGRGRGTRAVRGDHSDDRRAYCDPGTDAAPARRGMGIRVPRPGARPRRTPMARDATHRALPGRRERPGRGCVRRRRDPRRVSCRCRGQAEESRPGAPPRAVRRAPPLRPRARSPGTRHLRGAQS